MEHEQDPPDGDMRPGSQVERALDAWALPPALDDFRRSLRDAFVRGEAPAEELERDVEERLGAWREPPPPARYRERVRRAFVRDSGGRGQLGRPPRGARTSRTQRARWLPWIAGSAAAVALVLAFLALRDRELAPRWRLALGSSVPDGLVIDGVAFEGGGSAELEGALARARTATTTDSGLRLVFGDRFLLEIEGSASLDLSRVPRDGESEIVLSADRGGFRIATGPGFQTHGRLRFETPHVIVTATGTVFGVDIFPDMGSCICCTESAVDVVAKALPSDVRKVEAGQTDFVDAGGAHSLKPIYSLHEPGLRALHDAWR